MSHPDVLVLGGGIIGLSIARALAGAGLEVEVLERLHAGAEASLAAAGMLAPLSETPSDDAFFAACRASRDLWAPFAAALEAESDLTIDLDREGALAVAFGVHEAEALGDLAMVAHRLGEPAEEIEPAAFLPRLPDLSPEISRALFLPGEHRVDNVQALAALFVAARRLGVAVSYGCEVHRIEVLAGGTAVRVEGDGFTREAARLVLAAGAWSGTLSLIGGLPPLNPLPPLPVTPVRGQMALLGGIEWPFKGTVRCAQGYAARRGLTGLVVGSTTERAGFAAQTTAGGIGGLLTLAGRLFPALAEARLEAVWAGLRPATPDGWPLLGFLPGLPVIAATGHYRNGILLAPWTAERIAELVLEGGSAPLAPFSPQRFLPANA